MERALLGLGLRRWHHWHIIGAWVWELSIAPKAWRRQAELVSEIWAPSQFVARTFSARYDKPVRIVPHHVPIVSREKGLKATSQKLTILSIADARSSLERKNPHAAIRMFRAAFDQDAHVELIVKCRNLSLFPKEASELRGAIAGDPRIQLHDETLDHKKQADLVESADIFLSPHRSEGFGLNLAEAMAAGKCVIATGWSGNMDFMSDETAELLPYKLVPTLDASGVYIPEPGACWAEPDFDAGVVALKSLLANPNRRASIGARAQATIANSLGARKIVEAMDIPAPSP
jgi:glycosyltransferase involved in cell wall biosynthesis